MINTGPFLSKGRSPTDKEFEKDALIADPKKLKELQAHNRKFSTELALFSEHRYFEGKSNGISVGIQFCCEQARLAYERGELVDIPHTSIGLATGHILDSCPICGAPVKKYRTDVGLT